jgi:deoxyribonucleoside regulator
MASNHEGQDSVALLVQVATLYYEQDLNQQAIAEQLKISRSKVSRLLKEAKAQGIVEIQIRKPVTTVPTLERQLRKHFGLHQAMIVESGGRDQAEVLAAAGYLAARYLEVLLRKNDVLAISWGTGVHAAVSAFTPNSALQVRIVQMIGSVGSAVAATDGHELARQLASKLGGPFHYLPAPLIVDSGNARDVFLSQPAIAETLRLARSAQVLLLGIGTTEANASSFLRAGHLSAQQLSDLRRQGAVGETAGFHFDLQGNANDFDINDRVIALDLDAIKAIPNVVAVACGLAKRYSILGALRGGYIKSLATDDMTARAVLDAADS